VARIKQIFKDYDSQGIHRTGTATDTESAEWLAEMIRQSGQEPSLTSFPFSRIDPLKASLKIGNRHITGVPYFDGSSTDDSGIEGRLGALTSDAGIGVGNPWGAAAKTFEAARSSGRFKAMVAIADGSSRHIAPGLILMNADRFKAPFGPPVLQVSSEEGPGLLRAAEKGDNARLMLRTERVETKALNVETTVKGRTDGLAPVVVMTPRSGWYHCTSERGGGIACWLEMVRRISENRPRRDVRFVASTGHELGHAGLDHFLETHPTLIQDAHIWIHLGANFAASKSPAVLTQTSSKELEALTLDAMKQQGVRPASIMPPDRRPLGEARNIFDGSGRYISLLGSNGLFHHIDDRWPDAVDMDITVRLIDAFIDILDRIANQVP